MNKHISQQYDADLDSVKAELMAMGGLVEQQLAHASQALINHDIELAERVRSTDEQVNRMEIELDEQCVQIIARRAPTASDLRMLISVMRAITDLERIGDEADRIAKMAKGMHREEVPGDQYRDFRELNAKVAQQLAMALDAFARLDAVKAVAVIQGDEEVDDGYKAIVSKLIGEMAEFPDTINRSMNTIWAARALERIGDHAKNLGEYVVYQVNGEDVRHSSLELADLGRG
ncbi:MAG: phosphate signaling complex protein PhoU [Pseudomonadales bacterium]